MTIKEILDRLQELYRRKYDYTIILDETQAEIDKLRQQLINSTKI